MKKTIMAAAIAATLATATSQAATINLIDTGGVTGTEAETGFNIAANFWGDLLTNDVVINLGVGFQALDEGIIGSTGSTRNDVSVANWQAGINATKSNSTIDQTAVLPGLSDDGGVSALYNPYNAENQTHDSSVTALIDGKRSSQVLWTNSAILKAIGVDTSTDSIDGNINFSSNFSFDFDPSDGIEDNTFDFLSVAIHEIGHALGFISGVDIMDFFSGPNGGSTISYDLTDTSIFSALDMFRYSAEDVLDWRVGGETYFSIDGGATALFDNTFSTGRFNGDGQQASHWKDLGGCSDQLGILDPNSCFGQMGEVTGLDIAAYDAMGWNLSADALNYATKTTAQIFAEAQVVPVPVSAPAIWALVMGAFGFITVKRKSKK